MTVGIDIVETKRIDKLITRYGHRFLDKVFTEEEQHYCDQSANRVNSYAGRFASKEAIRKALQPLTGTTYLPFLQIEILPDNFGTPVVTIETELSVRQVYSNISLSISHEKHYAVACAIAEEK